MNINKTLSEFFIKNDFHITEDYDKKNLFEFLEEPCVEKKYDLAQKLIGEIVAKNGKEQLEKIIVELRKVESATMSIIEKNRDHVIHSLNTYLLGLYINKEYLNDEVKPLEWTLAALFHDVAYPAKISQQIIENYLEKMKLIKEDLKIESCDPVINLNPKYFEKLTNNKNAFEYMQERIDKWKLDVNVQERYDYMICSNNINHGILSALTILYLVDLMYQKNNSSRITNCSWDQKHFEDDIVSACSAIFLHDLKDDPFRKLEKNLAPLPYLLKLCDELQIWERPDNKKKPYGDSPNNCDISIEKDKINFIVKNNDEGKSIRENIECLRDSNITVNGKKCYVSDLKSSYCLIH